MNSALYQVNKVKNRTELLPTYKLMVVMLNISYSSAR